MSIQLILSPFTDPMDLIESFDLDYVQCALHNNLIYKTDACTESHLQRAILCYISECKFTRFSKALKKGFTAPYLGEYMHAPLITIADDSQVDYFTYIKKQPSKLIPVSIPVIHKLCNPINPILPTKIKNERYQTSIIPIEYKIGDIVAQTTKFALQINVTEINQFGCIIQPIKFGPITINICYTQMDMTLGDNIAIVSLHWIKQLECNKYALRLKIRQIVSKRYVPCILANVVCIDESINDLITQGLVSNSTCIADVEINKPEINKEKIIELINQIKEELHI